MTDATPQALDLVVNGEPVKVAARTLAALVAERGYGTTRVATAVNGAFVPASARAETILSAQDRIEIVSARQGG